jgi:hypothetical protein
MASVQAEAPAVFHFASAVVKLGMPGEVYVFQSCCQTHQSELQSHQIDW